MIENCAIIVTFYLCSFFMLEQIEISFNSNQKERNFWYFKGFKPKKKHNDEKGFKQKIHNDKKRFKLKKHNDKKRFRLRKLNE